jgi:hypothetical protein
MHDGSEKETRKTSDDDARVEIASRKGSKRIRLQVNQERETQRNATNENFRISVKIEKKNRNAEDSSSSSDSDGGGVGLKGKKLAIEYKPVSLTCKSCKKSFGPTVSAVCAPSQLSLTSTYRINL